ncbi:MAG: chloride channel protein [Hydrogenobaculum sp.]
MLHRLGYLISKQRHFLKWFILGIINGVVSGLGALFFYYSLKLCEFIFTVKILGYHFPSPVGEKPNDLFFKQGLVYLLPIVTAIGGLIAGFIVFKWAPEAEGHGTDAAIDAYHNKRGIIRDRVIFIKTIASAITIGSGGSAGREGPTALISAGISSWLARLLGLSERDRERILAVGIGAGIGTIFKAPIGGAILAAEILYKADLQADIIFPGLVASAIGYSIFGSIVGFTPVFGFYQQQFDPLRLPLYVILGVVCGIVGVIYAKTFYYFKDNFFKNLKLNIYLKPVLGMFITGIIGMAFPEILGTGYGWLQAVIDGKLQIFNTYGIPFVLFFISLAFIKIIATSFTVGSGASGGVFAPGLFIGGFLGAGMGIMFHNLFPSLVHSQNIGAFSIVGMLSLFGAAGKVPIAVTLMVVEMTGSYQLLPACMLAVATSYLISGDVSIYKSQVKTREDSPLYKKAS